MSVSRFAVGGEKSVDRRALLAVARAALRRWEADRRPYRGFWYTSMCPRCGGTISGTAWGEHRGDAVTVGCSTCSYLACVRVRHDDGRCIVTMRWH